MADKKISQLDDGAASVLATDDIPIRRGAANYRLTLQQAVNKALLTAAAAAFSAGITAPTFNGNTWATGTGTLSIAAGKTLTANQSLTLAGTDGTTMTFPTTSATLARVDAAQTFTGNQLFSGDVAITGVLTLNNPSTLINSTIVTIDDPIFTLGGDTAPSVDDNKDRGIEFRWHNGSVAKVGFFGYDDSAAAFTFIPDATNTSEVFSGAAGPVVFGTINGNTWTTGTGTLTLAAAKTLTVSNTITLTATDGSTLAIGTGGTLAGMAYQSGSWASPGAAIGTGTPVAITGTTGTFSGAVKVTGANAVLAANSTTLDYNVAGGRVIVYGPDASTNGTFTIYTARSDGSNGNSYFVVGPGGNVSIAAAGAVGAASLYLGPDTTSGLYRPAANQIGVTISGTQRGLWSSTGLNVTGTVTATTRIIVDSPSSEAVPLGLFAGITKGVRISTDTIGSMIEGVDRTGAASYQPLTLGGTYVAFQSSGAEAFRADSTGITFANAKNIVFNTSTGTKIGTATSQKLGFWNATPIIQPTTGVAAATFVANTSLIANDTATFDGYTLGQVVKALRNEGLLA